MAVRAKFKCLSVQAFMNGLRNYDFGAVTDNTIPENQRFHKYTPAGSLKLTVDNPDVSFTPGAEYYIDITPASEQ